MNTAPLGPGHLIAGKYRLVRQLGQGGMGAVWLADHLTLNSTVAIKLIDPSIAGSEEALGRFMREAQAAAALRSPHVVQTLDYGVDGGVPFIAMELLEGESLAQRLERVSRLPVEETAKIVTQVARAIARAHEAKIVHRDLKPDNVFLVHNDDEEVAKVLDFGIAKAGNAIGTSSSQTRTGAVLGTPYYMSPEQAEGNKSVDHRSDLWALAVIAFECVVGRRPFESDALGDLILQICVRPLPVPSQMASVPPGFDDWFRRGTERDPARRFQSARDLADELRGVAGLERRGRVAQPSESSIQPAAGLSASGSAFNGTTGGASAVAATAGTTRGSGGSNKPVVVATAATMLVVVSGLAYVVFGRGHAPAEAAEPAAATAAAGSAAATTAPAVPAAAAPAAPDPALVAPHAAVAPVAEPVVGPGASAAPAAAKPASVRPAATAAKPLVRAKPVAAPAPPAAAKPPARKAVDFGF